MFIWHTTENQTQDGSEKSYIGGIPTLPRGVGVPVFEKIGTEMTFFFQLEFPASHTHAGHTISVFSATDYIDDDSFIPKLPDPLAKAALNDDFFRGYQTFFRIILFETTQEKELAPYSEKIAFRVLKFTNHLPADAVRFGEVNDSPEWMLDDESPASFNGNEDQVCFLFQTEIDYGFATLPNAPRQKIIDYENGSGLADSYSPEYTLFTSNKLYFFGIGKDADLVYIVPQS